MTDAAQDALLTLAPQFAGMGGEVMTGGRTNRLRRFGDLVVKRYDTGAASPLFPNDPLAEARALAPFCATRPCAPPAGGRAGLADL